MQEPAEEHAVVAELVMAVLQLRALLLFVAAQAVSELAAHAVLAALRWNPALQLLTVQAPLVHAVVTVLAMDVQLTGELLLVAAQDELEFASHAVLPELR